MVSRSRVGQSVVRYDILSVLLSGCSSGLEFDMGFAMSSKYLGHHLISMMIQSLDIIRRMEMSCSLVFTLQHEQALTATVRFGLGLAPLYDAGKDASITLHRSAIH